MQKREKILVGIAAAVVLLWLGSSRFKNVLLGPIDNRRTQLNVLDQQLSEVKLQDVRVTHATQTLTDWKARSLPGDPLNAQRLYQVWLTDLAQQSSLSDVKVTPGRRVARTGAYTAVQITVEGKATLEQLSHFLFDFDRANLAHRIASLRMETEEHRGNPHLKITLTAEGLSVNGVEDRPDLFPKDADPVRPDYHDRSFDDYLSLVQNSPFVKPAPRNSPPPRSAPDPARETYLIASVAENDQRQAWLYRRSAGERTVIRKGSHISIGGVQADVVDITPESVVLQKGENTYTLNLGDSLDKVLTPKPTASDKSTAKPTPTNAPRPQAGETGSPSQTVQN